MHYIIRVKFNAHGINTKLKAIRDISCKCTLALLKVIKSQQRMHYVVFTSF